MIIDFYKYQGAGNDFIIIDNRTAEFSFSQEQVYQLCHPKFGIGGDGLMLLENADGYDFKMIYFNSDGRLGSMCGNGGRCIAAFAHELGLFSAHCTFIASDGPHHASFLSALGNEKKITLQMQDVSQFLKTDTYYFIDTGSPHHIEFHKNIKEMNVFEEGRKIRFGELYQHKGANVNFVENIDGNYHLRTYERGVENETLACGTGATAVALAVADQQNISQGPVDIHAEGGKLTIDFTKESNRYVNIRLSGPATSVFKGQIEL